ncbi:hypothetical protein B0H19DRAFT_1082965 [Mycena capillaripes]|nr:hypothetical protein B0H19DRAFT_1082965 [Mycena capillaripes]
MLSNRLKNTWAQSRTTLSILGAARVAEVRCFSDTPHGTSYGTTNCCAPHIASGTLLSAIVCPQLGYPTTHSMAMAAMRSIIAMATVAPIDSTGAMMVYRGL